MRRSEKLLDESAIRQSSFRPGRPIQLADGQTWILPAPPRGSEWNSLPFGPEYVAIIRAISESADGSEQSLAELAFAICLLGYNYHLSPDDYDCLLGSQSASTDSMDWQLAFHHIAQDHVHSFLDNARVSCENEPLPNAQGRFSRLWVWLRTHFL